MKQPDVRSASTNRASLGWPEGGFDDLRDLTEVTGLFGSNRHVHTRIVTTGTGATPIN